MTLVFPVGHYLGPFYPDPTDASPYLRIRVGDLTVPLHDQIELSAWALAHGTGAREALTAESYEAMLVETLGPFALGIVDELTEAGVVVYVPETGRETVAFAMRHRLRPLLSAIGPAKEGDGQPAGPWFGLGTCGLARALADPLLLDLWWWAGPSTDLWSLSQRSAAIRDLPAEDVLDHFLRTGHSVLSRGAAYLDQALTLPAAGTVLVEAGTIRP